MDNGPRRSLRSNFEPGSPREAVRRAQWKALGLTDADLLKPKIAVVNTSSELAICFSHLDGIARVVKEAVREVGGLPFEIRTAAPSDFIISAGAQGGYMLASRDLVVNDMEIAVEGAQLDGMICLSSCDKTPPAHLMAAGRFNIPTILVICGYQPSGHYNGAHVDIEEVFIGSVRAMFGKLSKETLAGMCDHAITGPGVCAGMGTANSMHIACEALGMTLPGAAPVLANSPKMFELARQSGRRIVEMVWEDLKPRDVMTAGAFRNAVAAVLAVSGSINCVKHLQAAAVEAGLDLDVFSLFNELGARVPVLSAVAPNGAHTIDQFEAAGGAQALLATLAPELDLGVRTVTGRTLGDDLAGITLHDADVIRPLDRAYSRAASIVVLRGTLAPESAIARPGLRPPGQPTALTGPALVFDSVPDALAALQRGELRRGQVLVLRGCGPVGGPGMAGSASRVVFAIYAQGLENDVAFVTDGQLSGLCNKGLTVAEVSPESGVGGPLALVENGDSIAVDIETAQLDLEVAEEELATRRVRLGKPKLSPATGYLSLYRRSVQPMSTGAVLVDTEERRRRG
ncbi:MAG TPA: dihydroxy-acid dehydratase [Vicinamibacterales bacterium]|nr:dihydroxy-acid dehydratase [Vicinamibacterales bacterium]